MQVRMRVKTSIGDPLNGYLEDDAKYTSNNIVLVQSEEQTARQAIINYVNKAKQHLFLIGNDEIGWQEHYILVEGDFLISIVGTTVDIYVITDLLKEIKANFGRIDIVENTLFTQDETFSSHLIFGTNTTDIHQWCGKEFVFPFGPVLVVQQGGLLIKTSIQSFFEDEPETLPAHILKYANVSIDAEGKVMKNKVWNQVVESLSNPSAREIPKCTYPLGGSQPAEVPCWRWVREQGYEIVTDKKRESWITPK